MPFRMFLAIAGLFLTAGSVEASDRITLDTFNVNTRYRAIEGGNRQWPVNHLQSRLAIQPRLRLDSSGKYTVHAGIFTGERFTSGWSNTGVGTGDAALGLRVKQLYFRANPLAGIEYAAGGLPIARGETTEVTSYDVDGYITGHRVALKREELPLFDELSVTVAAMNPSEDPNVFRRLDGMGRLNYGQVLATKRLNSKVAVSLDYSRHAGIDTVRQGLTLNRITSAVDVIRIDSYQRLQGGTEFGGAIAVDKRIGPRLTAGGGAASIGREAGRLNADRFMAGDRVFATTSYQLAAGLSVSSFVTFAFRHPESLPNRSRFDVVLSYDLLRNR